MFQEVLSIAKNYAIVKLSNTNTGDIIGYNVIFEDDDKRILGEVDEIIDYEAKISFIGEFINNKYYSGIVRRPTLKSNVRIINQYELEELVGANDENTMVLGNTPLYNNYPVKVNINQLFNNNLAILGNSGSGKTCANIRIIQNLFNMKENIPFNANIFIFSDGYEYEKSLKDLNKININFNYKLYSNDINNKNANQIRIPLWLMDINDYIDILDIDSYFQVNLMRKMLEYVKIFANNDEVATKYKNHLIARAINKILLSNQTNSKIRDDIFNILINCHTEELNINAMVPGMGYTREFSKCFDIDNNGEFVEKVLVTKYIRSFIDNDQKFDIDDTNKSYNLNDLEVALDFTLIGEGLISNEKTYNEAMALKEKIHILNINYHDFFDISNYITIQQYVNSLLLTANNGRVQIVNYVFSDIDEKISASIGRILSRILFNLSKKIYSISFMPMLIILDDASKFININKSILSDNIFEKIVREGNKYGINLSLISAKPYNIPSNILSSCNNFMLFRIYNNIDLDYLDNLLIDSDIHLADKLKILPTGNCYLIGNIIRMPFLVKMKLPNSVLKNNNLCISDKWMVSIKNNNN